MEKIGTAVIGGGVVGLAIAAEISAVSDDVFLFEKNPYLGDEQSGRNSGVIHAGLYYDKYPLKRKLCVEGNRLLYEFCDRHKIPHARCGKFIVAVTGEEDKRIEMYIRNAREAGAEDVRRVSPAAVCEREPNVRAYSALWSPSTGIIDAASYIECLAREARKNGTEIVKETKVCAIKAQACGFTIEITNPDASKDEIFAERIINSAGLYSDEIARMINPESPYEITPVRGEYYYFNSSARVALKLNGTNVYPVQKPYFIDGVEFLAIGVHLTPVFELNAAGEKVIGSKVLVGPTTTPVTEKDDLEKNRNGVECFLGAVNDFFPDLKITDLKIDYAGNRAKLKTGGDFIIRKDAKYPDAINLIGIESPGLTASLAIAEFVKNLFIN